MFNDEVRSVPKPEKKEKKPYKGLQTKTPLQAKQKAKKNNTTIKSRSKEQIKDRKLSRAERKKYHVIEQWEEPDVKIPSNSTRNDFSGAELKKIWDHLGTKCFICKDPRVQHHHAKFRSGQGRGVWRNGIPLCKEHHDLAHSSRSFADKLRNYLRKKFGEDYYKDKYDLWLEGKIDYPDSKKFENYMDKRGGVKNV